MDVGMLGWLLVFESGQRAREDHRGFARVVITGKGKICPVSFELF